MSTSLSGPRRAATPVALAGLAAVLLPLLLVAAGPIATDDLWFHLGAGRSYASEGPWPARDPLLHTAHADAPVQHEWAFGVAVYAVERAFGLHGLRALHALAVLGLAAAAYATLRRAAPSAAAALFATSVWLALSWWRLGQLRPDLASIAAALATYALLFAPAAPPSWRRVAAFAALCALWANVHSLVMVGLALVVAALLGLGVEAALARAVATDPGRAARRLRARRLAAALALGALAALANPRGPAQHLTFLHSSRDTAVWQVRDEWIHFDPLSWRAGGYAENPVAWALTDALALAFVGLAGGALARGWRRRDAAHLAAFDAQGFGLGLAAFAAILVSIRFRWLAFLPLLYGLRALPRAAPDRSGAWDAACAVASVALALAFHAAGGVQRWTGLLPQAPREYLARPHVARKYHAEGVRFLSDAGLEGRLFNHYWMGGYLGWWLAPRLRTFVDGRTEHYAPDVLEDAQAVSGRVGARRGETSHRDVLDRRGVDVFFGVGTVPVGAGIGLGVYTADHLAGDPDWVPVFRAVDQAIYVRRAAGRANLERAAAFYRERGVPFDPEVGFEPERVMREAPAFARAWRLLPLDEAALREAASRGDGAAALAAAETLAQAYAVAGAWNAAIDASRGALALGGDSAPARRSLVYALLRTGRVEEARDEAAALQRTAPSVARAARIAAISRRAAAGLPQERLERLLLGFPLLTHAETVALLGHYGSASLGGRPGALAPWP
ncbi:MAG TPA: hypothetical protein VHQ66_05390 [Myxococcota bacterium]|nr:hypothetical protein [Myxococcota bacterium]